MGTVEIPPSEHEAYLRYRALSITAIVAVVLGTMSIAALFFEKLLILSVLGVIFGLMGWRKVARNRDELTGLTPAILGFVLSVITLVGGTGRAVYDYATEIPPGGFARIDFSILQPDRRYPDFPIPPSAMKLDGQKIFVKGYVHPGVDRKTGLKQFVLVPDMKTCCFGGQPALTDMIEVTLRDPLRVDYSFARIRLAGTLRVSPYKKAVSGLDGVYYQLDAEYVN